ncbi:hypothetical protein DNTS_009448 [Danionella cerebrum]|uniref:TNFR-Cys domain-containing protein n=1 Tax=Danionella cerebrum TaxID=2873325 RepID=A0A553PWS0_9TELE|nr:hypothetical protein DNTS_009448 [Danionella translucida]TRY82128.1 hypothetical protein DNTS_009448 [Danionella translucida]
MKVLTRAFLYLLLFQLHGSTAKQCPAGTCDNCPENQYSSAPGAKYLCQVCSKCGKGSRVVKDCTPTSNTECKCLDGYSALLNEKICVCKKGSGLDETGKKCQKCPDGFFTDTDNSSCKRWTECNNGIANKGSNISDVVCKKDMEGLVSKEEKRAGFETRTVKAGTTTSTVSRPVVTKAPHISTSIIQRTKSTSGSFQHTSSPTTTEKNYSSYIFWVVMLFTGIFLLVGIVYGWSKVTLCFKIREKEDSCKVSICRKPVEESGEKSLSLLV